MSGWTHVVVGAGAAGAVLAARLSEAPETRVLLLEAGGESRAPWFTVPMMTALLMRPGGSWNWSFKAEPSPGLDNRPSDFPRGRALGGSTAINGMVHVRGLPSDYDAWAQAGLPGWSWERVRPLFLRTEDFRGPGGLPEEHGTGGPLRVSRRPRPVSPLAEAYVEAGIAAGYPACTDFNGPAPEGFGWYHLANRDGRRESTASAFLRPARTRPNLTVLTGAEVLRVVVEHGAARGVEIAHRGRTRVLRAEAEVILSAGVIGSPKLLMLSGIGPAEPLHALGLPVIAEAPEVGRNLHDHVLIRVQHAAREGAGLHYLSQPHRAALAFAQAALLGTGPMSVFPLEAGAYVRSPGADLPDLQSHFLPALASAAMRFNPFAPPPPGAGPGFMANMSVMRPRSRGTVELASADPRVPPVIRPNLLADRHDLERLIDGAEILREVFAQRPFDRWRGAELNPGPDLRTRAELEPWVRRTANTVYHPVGACRMGADPTSVVDGALRVRGVSGLRVADASVFPAIPSANTAAPSMMAGEKAADLILGRTPD